MLPETLPALGLFRRYLVAMCLALAATLLLSNAVQAGFPAQESGGTETCVLCHQNEVQTWQQSPHAQALTVIEEAHQVGCIEEGSAEDCTCLTCHTTEFDATEHTFAHAGVTCEACHGPYVANHPDEGLMELDVDSSVCNQCHQETHASWQDTAHAEAGVQCIGCHKAHSQDLRLTDQALCTSCHRDQLLDSGHSMHRTAKVECVDCHISPIQASTSKDAVDRGTKSPSHEFAVAAETCVRCHGERFHTELPDFESQQVSAEPAAAAPSGAEAPGADCVAAIEARRSAPALAAGSLGLGMGLGGIVGIAGVLMIGYVSRGRKQ